MKPLLCIFLYGLLGGMGTWGFGQPPVLSLDPDSTQTVLSWIDSETQRLSQLAMPLALQDAEYMVRLGQWQLAEEWLAQANPQNPAVIYLWADLAIRQHRFNLADSLVKAGLAIDPRSHRGRLLQAQLHIQAWNLDAARNLYLSVLEESSQHTAALIGLGHIYLLQKNYHKALALAEQAISWQEDVADAYALAAEAHFWMLDLPEAEAKLRTCLRHDPLHPDARFAYGYQIWRHRKIQELPQMAAQWEIALKVHPLHYRTHWHWGNGHTQLTYRDYADPNELTIRKTFKYVDSLIVGGAWSLAMDTLQGLTTQYEGSPLPLLRKASAFYDAFHQQGGIALDSAAAIFQHILRKKPHYGPAHNGLAAVLKQRQLSYLQAYDSLEQVIADTVYQLSPYFAEVFPDVKRYPGPRVKHMVWQQLHTGVAYLPMLARLNRTFAIPPLHEDLATAMGNSYFRKETTFDNRQWMDIRGVGSGATGIEYVERGAHWERNVTFHEYVHLFHIVLFSEQEKRKVRACYFQAMKDSTYLDYYAANNEFEYLAQAFPAYFSTQKVHPLNHKSANTRADLIRKDTALFLWIDELVQRQRQFLAGDSLALAQNWAETYLALAKKASGQAALAYLDTAYRWDSTYLPTYLALVNHYQLQADWITAEYWLDRIAQRRSNYSPAAIAEAKLYASQFEQELLNPVEASEKIIAAYQRAMKWETDPWELADLNVALRKVQWNFGQGLAALETTEDYLLHASKVSTALASKYDEANAFWHAARAELGYTSEAISFFRQLTADHPQKFSYLEEFARILWQIGAYEELLDRVTAGQRFLRAAGSGSPVLDQYIILAAIGLGDDSLKTRMLDKYLRQPGVPIGNPQLWGHIFIELGDTTRCQQVLQRLETQSYPRQKAAFCYLTAKYHLLRGELLEALDISATGVDLDAYHFPLRLILIDLYNNMGYSNDAERMRQEGLLLPFPPGPMYEQILIKLANQ